MPERKRAQRPSSLACIQCRGKHLKCNAETPTCSRCREQGVRCIYTRSRRGLRKPQNTGDKPREGLVATSRAASDEWNELTLLDSSVQLQQSLEPTSPASFLNASIFADDLEYGAIFPFIDNFELNALNTYNAGPVGSQPLDIRSSTNNDALGSTTARFTPQLFQTNSEGIEERLLNSFYDHFFPAHPFVVPQRLFRQREFEIPRYLAEVMAFIGCHFAHTPLTSSHRASMSRILYSEGPANGFKVQSLMLLALVFHARFEEEECIVALQKACSLATDLRMFDSAYASGNNFGNEVVAESWRRTWWELVSMDMLISTFRSQQYTCCLQGWRSDHYLPGEEHKYSNCCPNSDLHTLKCFNGSFIRENPPEYSSFAYKIEAVRLLHSVTRSLEDDPDFSQQMVNTSLTNFFVSLPKGKRDIVNITGDIDEVLFSAHVIANMAFLIFHRSQSVFVHMTSRQPTQCTATENFKSPCATSSTHTSKALDAANRLSDATGAHLALKRRSPFLTCAIALAASIHLPAYMSSFYQQDRPVLKERLQLSISALNLIGEVWAIARLVRSQICKFACDVILNNQSENISISGLESMSFQPPVVGLED